MLELIEQVREDHGIHLIIASHLLPDVEQLCKHVWVLDKGEMKMSASIADLTTAARGAKRVRLAESSFAAFQQTADQNGLLAKRGRTEYELLLDSPDGVLPSKTIFELARQCGAQILSVQPAAKSLEDAFLEALEGENPSELPEGIA